MGFITKSDNIIHKRTYSGEKPFQCNQYGDRFSMKSTLESYTRANRYLYTRAKLCLWNHCNWVKKNNLITSKNTLKRSHVNVCNTRFLFINILPSNATAEIHWHIFTEIKPCKISRNTCDIFFNIINWNPLIL